MSNLSLLKINSASIAKTRFILTKTNTVCLLNKKYIATFLGSILLSSRVYSMNSNEINDFIIPFRPVMYTSHNVSDEIHKPLNPYTQGQKITESDAKEILEKMDTVITDYIKEKSINIQDVEVGNTITTKFNKSLWKLDPKSVSPKEIYLQINPVLKKINTLLNGNYELRDSIPQSCFFTEGGGGRDPTLRWIIIEKIMHKINHPEIKLGEYRPNASGCKNSQQTSERVRSYIAKTKLISSSNEEDAKTVYQSTISPLLPANFPPQYSIPTGIKDGNLKRKENHPESEISAKRKKQNTTSSEREEEPTNRQAIGSSSGSQGALQLGTFFNNDRIKQLLNTKIDNTSTLENILKSGQRNNYKCFGFDSLSCRPLVQTYFCKLVAIYMKEKGMENNYALFKEVSLKFASYFHISGEKNADVHLSCIYKQQKNLIGTSFSEN